LCVASHLPYFDRARLSRAIVEPRPGCAACQSRCAFGPTAKRAHAPLLAAVLRASDHEHGIVHRRPSPRAHAQAAEVEQNGFTEAWDRAREHGVRVQQRDQDRVCALRRIADKTSGFGRARVPAASSDSAAWKRPASVPRGVTVTDASGCIVRDRDARLSAVVSMLSPRLTAPCRCCRDPSCRRAADREFWKMSGDSRPSCHGARIAEARREPVRLKKVTRAQFAQGRLLSGTSRHTDDPPVGISDAARHPHACIIAARPFRRESNFRLRAARTMKRAFGF
jgi:hypothetical protein